MMVAPDGYILHVIPHYLSDSKNNDAAILQHAFEHDEGLRAWLLPGDIFVLDRGYLDVKDYLENQGFKVAMPAFLPKKQKQLSASEANRSRIVTRVRFTVEIVNRRWREWRFFSNVIHNKNYAHLNNFTFIVCALMNAYRKPIVTDNENSLNIARKMKTTHDSREMNKLKGHIDTLTVSKKSFENIDNPNSLQDFPRIDDIKDIESHITLGPYQINQAKSYIAEHLKEGGQYEIGIHKHSQGLLRAKIQSRHTSSKQYHTWIRYDPDGIGATAVLEWYCSCKAGARTVGCCAHVASVVCYLSHFRYTAFSRPAADTEALFLDARK
jgi:hypothetical protein